MKIAFHGAARTVTGSKHLLTLKNGKKVLLDCGMFQGLGAETDILNREFGFDPKEVDVMILSHAHIDHSGLIPRLVAEGFTGKILFLSYSNNLSDLFNKKSKPMFLFNHCLKEINDHISSIQIMDATVQCMLERLNYCSDN